MGVLLLVLGLFILMDGLGVVVVFALLCAVIGLFAAASMVAGRLLFRIR